MLASWTTLLLTSFILVKYFFFNDFPVVHRRIFSTWQSISWLWLTHLYPCKAIGLVLAWCAPELVNITIINTRASGIIWPIHVYIVPWQCLIQSHWTEHIHGQRLGRDETLKKFISEGASSWNSRLYTLSVRSPLAWDFQLFPKILIIYSKLIEKSFFF